jgi:hypothetical protein
MLAIDGPSKSGHPSRLAIVGPDDPKYSVIYTASEDSLFERL